MAASLQTLHDLHLIKWRRPRDDHRALQAFVERRVIEFSNLRSGQDKMLLIGLAALLLLRVRPPDLLM